MALADVLGDTIPRSLREHLGNDQPIAGKLQAAHGLRHLHIHQPLLKNNKHLVHY